MQFVSENGGRGVVPLLVLVVDGSTSKAEENGLGEGALDGQEHFSKGVPVAFVDDEHQAFLTDNVYGVLVLQLILLDVAHFLDGRDDKHFVLVAAF